MGVELDVDAAVRDGFASLPSEQEECRLLLRLTRAVRAGVLGDDSAAAAAELLRRSQAGFLCVLLFAPAPVLDLLLGLGLWDYDASLAAGHQAVADGFGDVLLLGARRGSLACAQWLAQHASAAEGAGAALDALHPLPRLEELAQRQGREALIRHDGGLLPGLARLNAGMDSPAVARLTFGLVQCRLELSEEVTRQLCL